MHTCPESNHTCSKANTLINNFTNPEISHIYLKTNSLIKNPTCPEISHTCERTNHTFSKTNSLINNNNTCLRNEPTCASNNQSNALINNPTCSEISYTSPTSSSFLNNQQQKQQRKSTTTTMVCEKAELKNSENGSAIILLKKTELRVPTTDSKWIQKQNIPIILNNKIDNDELHTWAICPISNYYAVLAGAGVLIYSIIFLFYAQTQSWMLYIMTGYYLIFKY